MKEGKIGKRVGKEKGKKEREGKTEEMYEGKEEERKWGGEGVFIPVLPGK